MLKRGLVVAVAAWMVLAAPAALAAITTIAPTEGPGVSVTYQNGQAGSESKGPMTTVVLAFPRSSFESDKPAVIIVGLENRTPGGVNFVSTSVVAVTQKGEVIPAMDDGALTAFYEKEKRRERSRARWTAFGNNLSAMGAGTSTTTGTVSGTYGAPGQLSNNFSGSVQTTTTNPYAAAAAAQAARAANEQRFAQAANVQQLLDAEKQRVAFKSQTVPSGQTHFTPVVFGALPKGTNALTLKVTVGPETHVFPLTVSTR